MEDSTYELDHRFSEDSKPFFKAQSSLADIETNKYSLLICKNIPSERSNVGRPIKYSHLRVHQCEKCPSAFPTERELISHKDIHSAKDIQCKDCKFLTKTKGCLSIHIKRIHMKKKSHRCQDCNKRFVSKTELKSHCQIHMEDRRRLFQCQICSYLAMNEKGLNCHQETHLGARVTCHFCDKTFSHKSSLRDHIKKVHQETKYSLFNCFSCSKAYKNKNHLKRHMISHEGLTKYSCSICRIDYISPNGFSSHMAVKHFKTSPTFRCEKCDKMFHTRKSLGSHALVHSDIRSFICSKCERPFKSKKDLLVHESIHTGARKVLCPICQVQLSAKNKIPRHIQSVHNTEKNHECEKCDVAFSQADNLKVHIRRVHDDVRKAKCYLCTFKATAQFKLKRHLEYTHEVNGKIETKCNQCSSIVKGELALRGHIKKVHTDHVEKCPMCDKDFADLRRHTQRVHSLKQSLKNELRLELQK